MFECKGELHETQYTPKSLRLSELRDLCAPDPLLCKERSLCGGSLEMPVPAMLHGGGPDGCDFGAADRLYEITMRHVQDRGLALSGGGGETEIPMADAEYVLNGGAHLVPEGPLRELYLFFANQPRSVEFTGGATGGIKKVWRGREAHLQMAETDMIEGDRLRCLDEYAKHKIDMDDLIQEKDSGNGRPSEVLQTLIDEKQKLVDKYDDLSRLTVPKIEDMTRRQKREREMLDAKRSDAFRSFVMVRSKRDIDSIGKDDPPIDLNLNKSIMDGMTKMAKNQLKMLGADVLQSSVATGTQQLTGGGIPYHHYQQNYYPPQQPVQQQQSSFWWITSIMEALKSFAKWLWSHKKLIICLVLAAILSMMLFHSLEHVDGLTKEDHTQLKKYITGKKVKRLDYDRMGNSEEGKLLKQKLEKGWMRLTGVYFRPISEGQLTEKFKDSIFKGPMDVIAPAYIMTQNFLANAANVTASGIYMCIKSGSRKIDDAVKSGVNTSVNQETPWYLTLNPSYGFELGDNSNTKQQLLENIMSQDHPASYLMRTGWIEGLTEKDLTDIFKQHTGVFKANNVRSFVSRIGVGIFNSVGVNMENKVDGDNEQFQAEIASKLSSNINEELKNAYWLLGKIGVPAAFATFVSFMSTTLIGKEVIKKDSMDNTAEMLFKMNDMSNTQRRTAIALRRKQDNQIAEGMANTLALGAGAAAAAVATVKGAPPQVAMAAFNGARTTTSTIGKAALITPEQYAHEAQDLARIQQNEAMRQLSEGNIKKAEHLTAKASRIILDQHAKQAKTGFNAKTIEKIGNEGVKLAKTAIKVNQYRKAKQEEQQLQQQRDMIQKQLQNATNDQDISQYTQQLNSVVQQQKLTMKNNIREGLRKKSDADKMMLQNSNKGIHTYNCNQVCRNANRKTKYVGGTIYTNSTTNAENYCCEDFTEVQKIQQEASKLMQQAAAEKQKQTALADLARAGGENKDCFNKILGSISAADQPQINQCGAAFSQNFWLPHEQKIRQLYSMRDPTGMYISRVLQGQKNGYPDLEAIAELQSNVVKQVSAYRQQQQFSPQQRTYSFPPQPQQPLPQQLMSQQPTQPPLPQQTMQQPLPQQQSSPQSPYKQPFFLQTNNNAIIGSNELNEDATNIIAGTPTQQPPTQQSIQQSPVQQQPPIQQSPVQQQPPIQPQEPIQPPLQQPPIQSPMQLPIQQPDPQSIDNLLNSMSMQQLKNVVDNIRQYAKDHNQTNPKYVKKYNNESQKRKAIRGIQMYFRNRNVPKNDIEKVLNTTMTGGFTNDKLEKIIYHKHPQESTQKLGQRMQFRPGKALKMANRLVDRIRSPRSCKRITYLVQNGLEAPNSQTFKGRLEEPFKRVYSTLYNDPSTDVQFLRQILNMSLFDLKKSMQL